MKSLSVAVTVCLMLGLDPALPSPWPAPDAAPAGTEKPSGPPPPRTREYSYVWDIVHHSLVRPVTRAFDWPRLGRQVTGQPREAENVDENDQVRLPSTWWQPRVGFRPVTVAQMLAGPGGSGGPAPGRWTITKAKTQGVTPGFTIEDSRGDKFLIKFDPPGHPELATGADVIGSHLLWAAGYNVPENTIAHLDPDAVDIADDATYEVRGRERKLTREVFLRTLTRAARRPDGTYRCVASRMLKGKPLGPFRYSGRRDDDPEDLIPHELRRELRGLWAIAAWLHHSDCRGPNSLDMWVTEGGRSFVRHHLIDFGSTLGSAAVNRKSPVTGTEYYVDFGVMTRQVATVGLAPFAWEDAVDPNIPAVGMVEAEVFDPRGWRTDYPNPAFDERTERDVRWGVRIVGAFSNEHIRAAVEAARYSDPRATAYLTEVLIRRRDKLVRAWRVPPREISGVAQ